MLSKLTLANRAGEDIVLHEDSNTSRRMIAAVTGLWGMPALRQSKRVRPQAHGSINETHYSEGSLITIDGEVWSTVNIEAAREELNKLTQVAQESVDNNGAWMKWTEGVSGLKLQKFVKLDSDFEPILKEAAAFIPYHAQFFAEDPRAYSQALTTQSSGSYTTGAGPEAEWLKAVLGHRGVAIDATHIYWSGSGCIGRATLAGGSIENEWIKGITSPTDIAVNSEHIYWASASGIGRATIAGGSIENTWITAAAAGGEGVGVSAIDIDASHLYWCTINGGIGRSTLAGGSIEKEWIAPVIVSPSFVAANVVRVDSAHVYWGLESAIGRATIAGAEANPEWIVGLKEVDGIDLSASYIYWTQNGPGRIGRAKLATGEPEEIINGFVIGLTTPTRIVVNSEHIYWNAASSGSGYISRCALSGAGLGGAVTVAQAGNRPTPLIFKIYGYWKNAAITRASDGAQLSFTGNIPKGYFLEVNVAKRTVTLNGADAFSMINASQTAWAAFEAPPNPDTESYFLSAQEAVTASFELLYRSAYA